MVESHPTDFVLSVLISILPPKGLKYDLLSINPHLITLLISSVFVNSVSLYLKSMLVPVYEMVWVQVINFVLISISNNIHLALTTPLVCGLATKV